MKFLGTKMWVLHLWMLSSMVTIELGRQLSVPSSMLIRYQTSRESFQTWDEMNQLSSIVVLDASLSSWRSQKFVCNFILCLAVLDCIYIWCLSSYYMHLSNCSWGLLYTRYPFFYQVFICCSWFCRFLRFPSYYGSNSCKFYFDKKSYYRMSAEYLYFFCEFLSILLFLRFFPLNLYSWIMIND